MSMSKAGDALEKAIESAARWRRVCSLPRTIAREAWALLTFPFLRR